MLLSPNANPAAVPTFGSLQALTFKDVARMYNVMPLQTRGITGNGTTVGIMTFASFKATDVAAYWPAVGLTGPRGHRSASIDAVTIQQQHAG